MQLGTEKTKGLDDDTIQLVQGHLIALHRCGSEECHGALGALVVEEFEARDKTLSSSKLADIISSMKRNLCCSIAEITAHPIPEQTIFSIAE